MDATTTTLAAALSVSVLVGLLTFYAMGLFGGNEMPVDGKTVLMTGASEGLGLAAAKQLAAKGANIVLVSRSIDKLQAALEDVKSAATNPNTQRFHYISADVSAPSYATPVLIEATAWNGGKTPDIVWCVAGVAFPELFVDMDMDSMRHQMDVNFFGTAEMTHSALKEWLAPDAPVEETPRHLIMTSSVGVYYPIPGYLPYLPSKFALRALAETLSREIMLYPQNVKVHLVMPGTILSPGFEKEEIGKPDITKKLEEPDPRQTPDEVALQSIRGLESGQFIITTNWLNWAMKCGSIGSAIRNSSFVEGLVAALMMFIVWPIVNMDMHGQIKTWRKKHGHPSKA